jgi:hypothetical protein
LELTKVNGAEVKGAATLLTHHVVMFRVWPCQLKVKAVAHANLGDHAQFFEQVKRAIDGGKVYVGIDLLGGAMYLVNAHVAVALRYHGQDEYALGRKTQTLCTQSL